MGVHLMLGAYVSLVPDTGFARYITVRDFQWSAALFQSSTAGYDAGKLFSYLYSLNCSYCNTCDWCVAAVVFATTTTTFVTAARIRPRMWGADRSMLHMVMQLDIPLVEWPVQFDSK